MVDAKSRFDTFQIVVSFECAISVQTMMKSDRQSPQSRVYADFNGLFDGWRVLCLSHGETCRDEQGNEVRLAPGMQLTAYDDDLDEQGRPDKLIATGTVEPSPEWLQCRGSRWILRVNEDGIRHESDIASQKNT
jgi:hypothetical protein